MNEVPIRKAMYTQQGWLCSEDKLVILCIDILVEGERDTLEVLNNDSLTGLRRTLEASWLPSPQRHPSRC